MVPDADAGVRGPDQVAPGIFRLALSLPGLELGHVNVYAIPGPDGVRLVDTGFDHPAVRAELEQQLGRLGASLEDVREAFVTHVHADHVGLSDWLIERAGATVLMWPGASGTMPAVEDRWVQATDWMMRNGMPPDGYLLGGIPVSSLRRPVEAVRPGQLLEWGAYRFEVVPAPGHAPQLACLIDRDSGLFFSSDHVLEHISPHVGSFSEADDHSLEDYLHSLDAVARLPVTLSLPGHGGPFADVAGRAAALAAHHEQRMREIVALLAADGTAQPAYRLAEQMTWLEAEDGWARLDSRNRVMALSETVAHLRHLQAAGRVRQHLDSAGAVSWGLPS